MDMSRMRVLECKESNSAWFDCMGAKEGKEQEKLEFSLSMDHRCESKKMEI